MSDHSEAFVAFDSSKLRNAVAIADSGRTGEIRFLGEIENSTTATAKLVRKLAGKYERLTFCYEAGPTGYELYRQIKSLGQECIVVAPRHWNVFGGLSSPRRKPLLDLVHQRVHKPCLT
jgi:transposase